MGERRMISKKITDTDKFLAMPLSAQALYFHLNTHGDDYGFVDKVKTIQRTIGASEDDLKLLIAKQYIIPFESGIVVIKDWFIHNIIRKDRLKDTSYLKEQSQLKLTENKTYEFDCLTTKCQPNDNQMTTNCRPNLTKLNLTKPNLTKPSKDYILSGKPDYAWPNWLSQESVETIKKGNPDKYDEKVPIVYLNQVTGKAYKFVDKNIKLVKARLREGYTLDDFKTVVDKKTAEWLNDQNMAKYLRPETLFGTKFDGYLNQPVKKTYTSNLDGIDLGF